MFLLLLRSSTYVVRDLHGSQAKDDRGVDKENEEKDWITNDVRQFKTELKWFKKTNS